MGVGEICPSCRGSLERSQLSPLLAHCPTCSSQLVAGGADSLPLVQRGAEGQRSGGDIALTDAFKKQYDLERLLGAGAMGAVYAARQKSSGRAVAIKFLMRLDSHEAMRRFNEETRLLAGLDHPNVISVMDAGSVSGHPYLVAELLEGGTLRERLIQDGKLPPDDAIRIARELLSGLAACHEAGIVHRDVKPENILFDADGNTKLADLGIARHFDHVGERLTLTGSLIGTPRYMSPEQVNGEPAGIPADLFAVGLILYEMLYGVVPLCGRTLADLFIARRTQRAQLPPSTTVRPQLGALVLKLLAMEPGERPASAREAAAQLAAVPTQDAQVDTVSPAVTRPRSGRVARAGGTGVSAAIAAPRPQAGFALPPAAVTGALLFTGYVLGWASHALLPGRARPAPSVRPAVVASAPAVEATPAAAVVEPVRQQSVAAPPAVPPAAPAAPVTLGALPGRRRGRLRWNDAPDGAPVPMRPKRPAPRALPPESGPGHAAGVPDARPAAAPAAAGLSGGVTGLVQSREFPALALLREVPGTEGEEVVLCLTTSADSLPDTRGMSVKVRAEVEEAAAPPFTVRFGPQGDYLGIFAGAGSAPGSYVLEALPGGQFVIASGKTGPASDVLAAIEAAEGQRGIPRDKVGQARDAIAASLAQVASWSRTADGKVGVVRSLAVVAVAAKGPRVRGAKPPPADPDVPEPAPDIAPDPGGPPGEPPPPEPMVLQSGDRFTRTVRHAEGTFMYSPQRGWIKEASGAMQAVGWEALPQNLKYRFPRETFPDR